MEWFTKLPPEVQAAIITLIVTNAFAVIKAFASSKKANFFEKAHEAAVVGIEHSDCEDCRKAAKVVAEHYGVEDKVKPVVTAVKAVIKATGTGPHAPKA